MKIEVKIKISKKVVAVFISLFSLFVMGAAESKMAMQSTVTASETLSYYQTIQKKQKLTSEESNIFQFVLVARDIFKIDAFLIEGHHSRDGREKALNVRSIALAIQSSLKQNKNWDETIAAADLVKIKSVEELIKTSLGANSFAVAWLNYKNGNKAEAKIILNRGFDDAYDNAMKMEYIGFSSEANPIQDGEYFSKALTPMSTEAENKSRADRLQKMQVRASNLPQIMT